jgi:hypothetical protein
MGLANYMDRIAFLDGQVLHDYHLNIMQKNMAEAIKTRIVQERYDMLMLVSPYNYYFSESFVNDDQRDPSSTAILNTQSFCITSDSWITRFLQLPTATSEICLMSDYEDNVKEEAFVSFYYRTAGDAPWIKVIIDQEITLPTPSDKIQIKIECQYKTTVSPIVYDFALMSK